MSSTTNNTKCVYCGAQLPDNTARYCSSCGNQVMERDLQTIAQGQQRPVLQTQPSINTIQDVETIISTLAASANQSLSYAMQAQLQVLRFIRAPKLVDSTFELLFENTRKALKYAESEKERDDIREKTSLMIHNYFFWVNTRLEYELMMIEEDKRANREAKRQLVSEAAGMLADSIARMAGAALSGGSSVIIQNVIVNELTTFTYGGEQSWLSKLIGLFTNKSRIKEKEEQYLKHRAEFYDSVDDLIQKTRHYKQLIGRSNLLAGIIERYADGLSLYHHENELQKGQEMKEDAIVALIGKKKHSFWFGTTRTTSIPFVISLVTFSILVIIILVRGLYKWIAGFFSDTVSAPWFLSHLKYSGIVLGVVVAVMLVLIGAYYLLGVLTILRAKKRKRKECKYYMQIADSFRFTSELLSTDGYPHL